MFPFKFLKPRMHPQYIDFQATVKWGVAAATTLWILQQQEKAPLRFDPSINLPRHRPGGVEPESSSPELRSNLPRQRPGGVGPKSRSPELHSSSGTRKPADFRSDETEGKAPLGSDQAAAETAPPRDLSQQRSSGVGPGNRSAELRRSLGTGKPADFRFDETQGQATEDGAAQSAPPRDLSKQWLHGVGSRITCLDLRRSLVYLEPADSTVDGTEMIEEFRCKAKIASIESKVAQLKLELAERNEIRKSPGPRRSYEGQAPLGSGHAAAETAPPHDLLQQRPGGVGPRSRSPELRRSLGTGKPTDFRFDGTQGGTPEHETAQSAPPRELSQQQLRGVGLGSRCHDLHKSLAIHKPADSGVDEIEMIEELCRKAKIASIQSEIANLKLELVERNEIRKSPKVRRSYEGRAPENEAAQSAPPRDLSQQWLRGVGSGSRCHDLHKSLAFHKPIDYGVDEIEMIEELHRKAKIASIQSEIAKLKLELAERNEIQKSPKVRRSYEQRPLGSDSAVTQSAPTGPVGPIDAQSLIMAAFGFPFTIYSPEALDFSWSIYMDEFKEAKAIKESGEVSGSTIKNDELSKVFGKDLRGRGRGAGSHVTKKQMIYLGIAKGKKKTNKVDKEGINPLKDEFKSYIQKAVKGQEEEPSKFCNSKDESETAHRRYLRKGNAVVTDTFSSEQHQEHEQEARKSGNSKYEEKAYVEPPESIDELATDQLMPSEEVDRVNEIVADQLVLSEEVNLLLDKGAQTRPNMVVEWYRSG
ncbi:hypothetical protein LguiB_026374 [Lonicera macranthoides]